MAGTYALESQGMGGGTYTLTAEEISRLVGEAVDGTFRITNLVTRRSVMVSNTKPLTVEKARRIGIEV